MAHYAVIDSENVVTQVFVGRHEDDLPEGVTDWEEYYAPENYTVKRTSFNTRVGVHFDPETGEPSADQSKAFRGNYAGIGFTYDEELDAFIPPKPSEDAILDEVTFSWVMPEEPEAE
jgi:hypothetical protein